MYIKESSTIDFFCTLFYWCIECDIEPQTLNILLDPTPVNLL